MLLNIKQNKRFVKNEGTVGNKVIVLQRDDIKALTINQLFTCSTSCNAVFYCNSKNLYGLQTGVFRIFLATYLAEPKCMTYSKKEYGIGLIELIIKKKVELRENVNNKTSENVFLFVTKMGKIIAFVTLISKTNK